ncbi:MAG: hypothetical protein C7B43_17165 [Sulfobacillus benefaciens]|uniref:Uncharacterized protein n=1 Tax=Sulfobacillus benefaciens TaxID=453960 RepID=A0A2T2WSS8_9FIRM|nr:MAG: hypothetical protein C7B43_17165 [Sulfobacillus benefaciens]HBQ96766.1 hypothetical protein [Sulfobacillus sp.]
MGVWHFDVFWLGSMESTFNERNVCSKCWDPFIRQDIEIQEFQTRKKPKLERAISALSCGCANLDLGLIRWVSKEQEISQG